MSRSVGTNGTAGCWLASGGFVLKALLAPCMSTAYEALIEVLPDPYHFGVVLIVALFPGNDLLWHLTFQTEKRAKRSNSMLILQEVSGLTLTCFSVFFMLWFLRGLVRESLTHRSRTANPPVEERDSWQSGTLAPRAHGSPRVSPLRALPSALQSAQASRLLRTATKQHAPR